MSAVSVSYIHLECDTCGTRRAVSGKSSTLARIEGATEGWKYAEWDVSGMNKYAPRDFTGSRAERAALQKIVPRQWDACPGCPLPLGPKEAFDIREKRKQAEATS